MTGEFIGTGSLTKSDLPALHNLVQYSFLHHPKDIFIAVLRDYYSQDSYYHYQADVWGYPLTPDHTNLHPEAGLIDDSTTRVYIGEAYRHDIIYYPAILVRGGPSRSVPLSFNRNKETVLYGTTIVSDGYGNNTVFTTPTHFVRAGAWEGSLSIEIHARGPGERDDLIELTSILFEDMRHDELLRAGVLIKAGGITVSAPTEEDDRNEKLFKQSISVDIRTEWRRQIPVDSLIDAINICVEFGNISSSTPTIAENLTINSRINLLDVVSGF